LTAKRIENIFRLSATSACPHRRENFKKNAPYRTGITAVSVKYSAQKYTPYFANISIIQGIYLYKNMSNAESVIKL
jgi:hypothetical protein